MQRPSMSALARRQLSLLEMALPRDAPQGPNRDLVVAALARLLLEAAGAGKKGEGTDDAP